MTSIYPNGRKVENLRSHEVYEFRNKIWQLLYQNGYQILGYAWRLTQKKDEQMCSICRTPIAPNKSHFLIKAPDKEFGLRMHAGKCLQDYLTGTLNRATKLLGDTVDTSWDDMLKWEHPKMYERRV